MFTAPFRFLCPNHFLIQGKARAMVLRILSSCHVLSALFSKNQPISFVIATIATERVTKEFLRGAQGAQLGSFTQAVHSALKFSTFAAQSAPI